MGSRGASSGRSSGGGGTVTTAAAGGQSSSVTLGEPRLLPTAMRIKGEYVANERTVNAIMRLKAESTVTVRRYGLRREGATTFIVKPFGSGKALVEASNNQFFDPKSPLMTKTSVARLLRGAPTSAAVEIRASK